MCANLMNESRSESQHLTKKADMILFRFRAEVVTLQVSKTLEKEKKGCV